MIVEKMNVDAINIGLRESRVQPKTELALRSTGIPIALEAKPCVYVNIEVVGRAGSVDVSAKRPVVSFVGPEMSTTTATVWSWGNTGRTVKTLSISLAW